MNREHWAAMLPIITAFANGEKVEVFDGIEEWEADERIAFNDKASNYRIAPRTIRIGAFDVPEPYRGEMKMGQEYYSPAPDHPDFIISSFWGNYPYHQARSDRGCVHLTPEAAALHGKALASLTAGEGVEL